MNAPVTRRGLLGVTAAVGVVGLPVAAHPDPFTRYGVEILTLQAAVETGCPDDEAERLMDRWTEIDRLALAGQPTTLAGALGALEMARREFSQFQVVSREDADDPSKALAGR